MDTILPRKLAMNGRRETERQIEESVVWKNNLFFLRWGDMSIFKCKKDLVESKRLKI